MFFCFFVFVFLFLFLFLFLFCFFLFALTPSFFFFFFLCNQISNFIKTLPALIENQIKGFPSFPPLPFLNSHHFFLFIFLFFVFFYFLFYFIDHLQKVVKKITKFKKRGGELASGALKNEACLWWLDHIAKRVDEYAFFFFFLHSFFHNFKFSNPSP